MAKIKKLIVMAGPNGAGKTAVVQAAREFLKAKYGEVVAFELDDIFTFIHNDWAEWAKEWSKERVDKMPYTKVSLSNAATLVNNFFNNNFKIVFLAGDILASRILMKTFSDMIDNETEIFHFILDPGDDVLIPRLTERYKNLNANPKKAEETLKHLQKTHDKMRSEIGPWTFHLDNSKLTPEETLNSIMETTKNKSNYNSCKVHGSRKGYMFFKKFLPLLGKG